MTHAVLEATRFAQAPPIPRQSPGPPPRQTPHALALHAGCELCLGVTQNRAAAGPRAWGFPMRGCPPPHHTVANAGPTGPARSPAFHRPPGSQPAANKLTGSEQRARAEHAQGARRDGLARAADGAVDGARGRACAQGHQLVGHGAVVQVRAQGLKPGKEQAQRTQRVAWSGDGMQGHGGVWQGIPGRGLEQGITCLSSHPSARGWIPLPPLPLPLFSPQPHPPPPPTHPHPRAETHRWRGRACPRR